MADPEKPAKGRSREGARELASVALAAGRTAKEAATVAGVHERTLRKWLANDPEFKRGVDQLRAEAVGSALGRLSSSMSAAADALKELIGNECPHVRFKASKAIIETAMKLTEFAELEKRIADLEQRLKS